MKRQNSAYTKLAALSKKAQMVSSIESLLSWDQETYMPKKGIAMRSQQRAYMAHLIHQMQTGTPFKKALSALVDLGTGECFDDSLSFEKRAALREWRRDFVRGAKLPAPFVKKLAHTTSQARHSWQEAKERGHFKIFAPHLEKIVALMKQKADYLGYDEHPYDALVDEYEPCMTTARLNSLFSKLQIELTDLLKKILEKPVPQTDFLFKTYEAHKQLHFGKELLQAMGFSKESSRVDPTAHPFCLTLSPDDLRLTTWIHPENPMTHISAILHEGGHGIYEQNLPAEHFGTPLGQSVSLGVHESQSRFWEVLIGSSLPFWHHFYPLLQKEFPQNLNSVSLETFYKGINRIEPSLIRVEADEVTYCLHVILRFEIEKALMEGHLKVADIPDAWNDKMRSYLGIAPSSDASGCLQDMHWSTGAFGYFPTYALGNLYAAQLLAAYQKEAPHWHEALQSGSLQEIRSFLATHVHLFGRLYPPETLIQNATKEPLGTTAYLHYLTTKYSALYHL